MLIPIKPQGPRDNRNPGNKRGTFRLVFQQPQQSGTDLQGTNVPGLQGNFNEASDRPVVNLVERDHEKPGSLRRGEGRHRKWLRTAWQVTEKTPLALLRSHEECVGTEAAIKRLFVCTYTCTCICICTYSSTIFSARSFPPSILSLEKGDGVGVKFRHLFSLGESGRRSLPKKPSLKPGTKQALRPAESYLPTPRRQHSGNKTDNMSAPLTIGHSFPSFQKEVSSLYLCSLSRYEKLIR